MNEDKFVQTFKMMGHPIRLEIIKLLHNEGEHKVGDIVDQLDLPQATVSQQLAKLKSGDIVQSQRHGTNVHYWLNSEIAGTVIEAIEKLENK